MVAINYISSGDLMAQVSADLDSLIEVSCSRLSLFSDQNLKETFVFPIFSSFAGC